MLKLRPLPPVFPVVMGTRVVVNKIIDRNAQNIGECFEPVDARLELHKFPPHATRRRYPALGGHFLLG